MPRCFSSLARVLNLRLMQISQVSYVRLCLYIFLVLTIDFLEEILEAFPWWDSLHGIWAKHPKNSITIISNSSVGTSKLVCEFDQAALGTRESSVVSMPPPTLPCDPDDVEDEGAVKVHLKLFKVFYCSCIYTFCQDMTALPLLTPSQTPLQSPLQLLSELPPDHELYLPEEAKPEVKPILMTTPWALASAASSSVASSLVFTPHSTRSMKTKHDYVADLHEQGHAEQVQTVSGMCKTGGTLQTWKLELPGRDYRAQLSRGRVCRQKRPSLVYLAENGG